jgi:hypothetical protein
MGLFQDTATANNEVQVIESANAQKPLLTNTCRELIAQKLEPVRLRPQVEDFFLFLNLGIRV